MIECLSFRWIILGVVCKGEGVTIRVDWAMMMMSVSGKRDDFRVSEVHIDSGIGDVLVVG